MSSSGAPTGGGGTPNADPSWHGDAREREAEILMLRHQVVVLKRKTGRPRLRRSDRMLLAALSRFVPKERWSCFIVSPQTLLRWHRELVAHTWTFRHARTGRPPPNPELVALSISMARRNQLSTRRVQIVGVTRNPGAAWVTQQARNLSKAGELEDARFLIRDRGSKFTAADRESGAIVGSVDSMSDGFRSVEDFSATSPASPGDVAQLVEHRLCKAGVAGSNPVVSTHGCRVPGDAGHTGVT